jgi:hypothetical protein
MNWRDRTDEDSLRHKDSKPPIGPYDYWLITVLEDRAESAGAPPPVDDDTTDGAGDG